MKPRLVQMASVATYVRSMPYPPGKIAVLYMRDLVVVIAKVTVTNYYMCLTAQGIVYIYDYDLHNVMVLTA